MDRTIVPMGTYTKIRTGKLDANASSVDGTYPFFTCSREPLRISSYSYDCECVLVAGNGDLNVKYYLGKFDAYQRTYIIESTDKQKLNTRYLYYFLDKYVDKLREQSIGGVIKYIKLGYLTEAQMPLPTLSEQERIINILDRAGALIEKRKAQIDKLDLLVKSQFAEMFGDPVTNPKGWAKKALGKECDVITGNTPSRAVSDYYGDYIEWIKSDNINTPYMHLTQASEMLSEAGLSIGRCVQADTILMTCIAGSISCIGNVAIADRKVSFNQQINAVVPHENNVYYMYYLFLLSKSYIQSAVSMSLKGILSKGKMLGLEFPFPPTALQNEFSDFVERVEAQKSLLQKSLAKLELNYKSLMQKCFRGEVF